MTPNKKLRVLLLFPALTYRAEAFLTAARRLRLDVTVGSEEESTMARINPSGLLALDFENPDQAARTVAAFARMHPVDAVIPVDERTVVVAAAIAQALALRHNSVQAASAAADKHRMRESLQACRVPEPAFRRCAVDDDAALLGRDVSFPCILKPVVLSGSRGVIRADNKAEFVSAFARLAAILDSPEIKSRGAASRQILVEEFIPGKEVAVEGILSGGAFRLLAIFDKPDSLDGPFFEETIYVTPSRLPVAVQQEIAECAARACGALGLTEGPVHAELRINDAGPWVIEVAARSIGGHCSRVLRFRGGRSLEELILQQALGLEIGSLQREQEAAGVMMIPIPRAGVLEKVRGLAEASATQGIDEILITAHPGQRLVPLPEGSRYLGFIFASGAAPDTVEAALREAHHCLEFVMVEGAETTGLYR